MKALAASSIGQYGQSVQSLADYYRTVELGLGACFRDSEPVAPPNNRKARLADAGIPLMGLFPLPNSVAAIAPLVGRIQIESEASGPNTSSRVSRFFITARNRGRSTNLLARGCCRWPRNGRPIARR